MTIVSLTGFGLLALACNLFSVTVRNGVTVTTIALTNPGAALGIAQTAAAQALTQVALTALAIIPVESAFAPTDATAIPPSVLTGTPPAPSIQPEAIAEAIVIIDPVPGSVVTSPVHVVGEADPTFEQSLVVQVTAANGRVIATVPTTIQSDVGQRGPFVVEAAFTVTEEQPGRISVYAASARDGGLTHLSSVEVTLRP